LNASVAEEMDDICSRTFWRSQTLVNRVSDSCESAVCGKVRTCYSPPMSRSQPEQPSHLATQISFFRSWKIDLIL
jgi:hypothetical protein